MHCEPSAFLVIGIRVKECVIFACLVGTSPNGFDESTQSLVAGELSLDHPNGSATSSIANDVIVPVERGLPEQAPVEVTFPSFVMFDLV